MARSCGLLNHRRVLLRDLIHLVHGVVDFAKADGLFLCRGCNFRDQRAHILDTLDNVAERRTRAADKVHTLSNLSRTCRDQLFDLFCRF